MSLVFVLCCVACATILRLLDAVAARGDTEVGRGLGAVTPAGAGMAAALVALEIVRLAQAMEGAEDGTSPQQVRRVRFGVSGCFNC